VIFLYFCDFFSNPCICVIFLLPPVPIFDKINRYLIRLAIFTVHGDKFWWEDCDTRTDICFFMYQFPWRTELSIWGIKNFCQQFLVYSIRCWKVIVGWVWERSTDWCVQNGIFLIWNSGKAMEMNAAGGWKSETDLYDFRSCWKQIYINLLSIALESNNTLIVDKFTCKYFYNVNYWLESNYVLKIILLLYLLVKKCKFIVSLDNLGEWVLSSIGMII